MNYSHGIVNNVMQSIRMAYENDIMEANIIWCFVKMRIYVTIAIEMCLSALNVVLQQEVLNI